MVSSRLLKEYRELKSSERDLEIDLQLVDESDIFVWKAFLQGPRDTPYVGGTFELSVQCPSTYPLSPPKVTFLTKIFHPNVLYTNGEICLDILKPDAWTPAWTLMSVCRAVTALLSHPEADSPLNCDCGERSKLLRPALAHMTCPGAKPPAKTGAAAFMKGDGDDSDDSDDEKKRVVRSQRDKKWEAMVDMISQLKNDMKINDWNALEKTFASLEKALAKAHQLVAREGTPVFYFKASPGPNQMLNLNSSPSPSASSNPRRSPNPDPITYPRCDVMLTLTLNLNLILTLAHLPGAPDDRRTRE
ncbi:MAG: hypothetical protein SGPRY_013357 [Prymnesium sp.]